MCALLRLAYPPRSTLTWAARSFLGARGKVEIRAEGKGDPPCMRLVRANGGYSTGNRMGFHTQELFDNGTLNASEARVRTNMGPEWSGAAATRRGFFVPAMLKMCDPQAGGMFDFDTFDESPDELFDGSNETQMVAWFMLMQAANMITIKERQGYDHYKTKVRPAPRCARNRLCARLGSLLGSLLDVASLLASDVRGELARSCSGSSTSSGPSSRRRTSTAR